MTRQGGVGADSTIQDCRFLHLFSATGLKKGPDYILQKMRQERDKTWKQFREVWLTAFPSPAITDRVFGLGTFSNFTGR